MPLTLLKTSSNSCRSEQTETTHLLSELAIVVDKMHMAGHVDSWCKKTCDPHLFPDLNSVLSLTGQNHWDKSGVSGIHAYSLLFPSQRLSVPNY